MIRRRMTGRECREYFVPSDGFYPKFAHRPSSSDPYPATVAAFLTATGLPTAPVALWRFNNNTTITDITENGNDLTVSGSPSVVESAALGGVNCLRFTDNSSAKAEHASDSFMDLQSGDRLAIMMVCTGDDFTTNSAAFVCKRTASTGYEIRVLNTTDNIRNIVEGGVSGVTTAGGYDDGAAMCWAAGFDDPDSGNEGWIVTDRETIKSANKTLTGGANTDKFSVGAGAVGLTRNSTGFTVAYAAAFDGEGGDKSNFSQTICQNLLTAIGI